MKIEMTDLERQVGGRTNDNRNVIYAQTIPLKIALISYITAKTIKNILKMNDKAVLYCRKRQLLKSH